MPRAFISLYFIIVLSVILVGWGLDRVWQLFIIMDDVKTPYETRFYQALEVTISNIVEDKEMTETQKSVVLKHFLEDFNSSLAVEVDVISIDDIAGSSISDDIDMGELRSIVQEDGNKSAYKRIGKTRLVLQANSFTPTANVPSRIYYVFIVIFYSLIALVVYFWLWPLTRDLKIMENATCDKSEDGFPAKVILPFRSTIYPLAKAFNLRTEKIRDLVDSHEEMSYAMSHELRTPLARMKFGLEILYDDFERQNFKELSLITAINDGVCNSKTKNSDTKKNELILKSIDGLRNDIVQMDSLVSELLNYACFERSSSIKVEQGDLLLFVEHHVKDFREANRLEYVRFNSKKEIEFVIRSNIKIDHVICDWQLMARAFINIMENAMKYTSSKIFIDIESDDLNAVIAVSDDGPGISDEDQDRIFNSFVRLRKNQEDAGTGFGLGLAIVRRVLGWHNGSVKVSRSNSGGACFTLSWPAPKE